MKSVRILLLFTIILSINKTYGQLSYASASIYDIQTLDGTTFIAVGENGSIRKTVDAGKTWRIIKPVVYSNLYAISMASNRVIYACGSAGVIKSVDGGENWEYLGDPTFNWDEDIFFIDENNGYVLGAQGYISKTTDGGRTWTECERPLYLSSTGVGYFTQIVFRDKNTGYVTYEDNVDGKYHQLFKTTDGGKSWKNTGYEYKSILFPAGNVGYALKGFNTISKTTNNGRSWVDIKLNIYDVLTKINFIDGNRGYALTMLGSIYYTNDGAITWRSVGSLGITLNGISGATNSENVIAVGSNASILISENNGIDWILRSLSPPVNLDVTSPFFVNGKVGFAFCKGFMNKTLDGGVTWFPYPLGFDDYIFDSYFLTEQRGFLVTENGLYKTVDGGINWSKLSFYHGAINHIYFINNNVGFIYGDWCTLYKTYDGGETWSEKKLPYISQGIIGVSSMQFVSESVGFLVGDEDKTVCKTTDGGETWVTGWGQPSGLDIFFLNDSVGFTGRGTLFKTTDSGASWKKIQFQEISAHIESHQIVDIHFVSEQEGFILTDYDKLFYTQTGGATWTSLRYGEFSSGMHELGAFGDSTVIGVGSTGMIIKMIFKSKEEKTIDVSVPQSSSKYLVYPNPVIDKLYIRPLLGNQEIEYKLYSINGQLLLSGKTFFDGTPIQAEIPLNYKGIALLQIISSSGSHSEKIVIQ